MDQTILNAKVKQDFFTQTEEARRDANSVEHCSTGDLLLSSGLVSRQLPAIIDAFPLFWYLPDGDLPTYLATC
jgi:hypothetical protein